MQLLIARIDAESLQAIPDPSGTPFVFLWTETYSAGGGNVEADQLSFTPGYLATAGHGVWKVIRTLDVLEERPIAPVR
jgi:hypothetical protein